jgi:pSer/pThr/pTyr-binding forkhead associated (FHA) protein
MAGWILESSDPALVLRLPVETTRTVGRTSKADFILDAPLVSRVHCRLAVDKSDRLSVEDLASTNGILLNGRRIIQSTLEAGDVLTIGRVEFTAKLAT